MRLKNQVIALFLLFITQYIVSSTASLDSVSKSPCGRDDVPCLVVPNCTSLTSATTGKVDHFYLTNVGPQVYKNASSLTQLTMCHSKEGLHIKHYAQDNHIFSKSTKCNDPVWQQGGVLEVFVTPVDSIYDVPRFYWEIDGTPNGNLFVSLIKNANSGNTTCAECRPGDLPCSGHSNFAPHKLSYAAQVHKSASPSYWETQFFIPFSLFPEKMRSSKIWRGNFYRYDYPKGQSSPHELSGWSPTFNGSFHIPNRFGVIVLQ